jgi:4-oxalocrotonate tautomerase
MPYVNVKITRSGVTKAHKRAIVEGITQLLTDTLGKKPEHTHIVIDLIDEEDWGFAGMLTDDWRKKQGQAGERRKGVKPARRRDA